MTDAEFTDLAEAALEPVNIGPIELRNRVILGAVSSLMENRSGQVTDQMIDFFVRRAAGGASAVTLGIGSVVPNVKVVKRQLALYRDDVVDGLSELCDRVHDEGASVAVQLHHAGRLAAPGYNDGTRPKGPSEVSGKLSSLFGNPIAMTENDIEEVISAYGQATRRAVAAGCDILEIHAAHGHGLPQQFLSPYSNDRSDRWGGSLDNRLRFTERVIEEVRAAAGDGKAIIFRLSADEYVPGGLRIEESKTIAVRLEEMGIDSISISAGNYDAVRPIAVPPPSMGRNTLVHLSSEIKDSVSLPVMVAGRIMTMKDAGNIIAGGEADAAVVVRALIADPDFASPANATNVRPCVGTMWCLRDVRKGVPIECSVNPAVGHEASRSLSRKKKRSATRVLVIGGGPAGLEAARIAALRGHEVVLAERADEIGGQLRFASNLNAKSDFRGLIDYYEAELTDLGVDITTSTQVSPGALASLDSNHVIVATGPTFNHTSLWEILPPSSNAVQEESAFNEVTTEDVLSSKDLDGLGVGNVVVVLGTDSIACDTAELVAQGGRSVTLVGPTHRMGHDTEAFTRREQLTVRFPELGIHIREDARVIDVRDGRDLVLATGGSISGGVDQLAVDTLVCSSDRGPDVTLASKLRQIVKEVEVAGSCRVWVPTYAGIHNAVHDGYKAGVAIASQYHI